MLKVLRDKTKSLHWVLWLIIASFILLIFVQWGGAGSGGRTVAEAGWAAKIGERTVTTDEFINAYKATESFYQNQLGQSYQRGLFFRPEDVLNDLIDEVLLEDEAGRLGLVAAPAEIARSIRERSDLRGDDGRFDRELYDRLLNYNGLNPHDFEEREGRRLRVRKLNELMRSGVAIADDEVRRTWMERNQTVSFSYVLVPSSDFTGQVEVDEAAFRSWFEDEAENYDAGPGRLVRWVRFDRATAQDGLEDQAQMREYYEENKDLLYTLGPEQRRASQVLVRLPAGVSDEIKAEALATAEAIAVRARAGEDFAALAAAESDDASTKENGGDLGPFYAGTYDPAFDAAVFAATEGEVIGPIESLSPAGYVVALVTKGEGEMVRPFDEVSDLVARGLYAADAAKRVRSQLEDFQSALAANPDFGAAAAASGLSASAETWLTRAGGALGDGPGPAAVARAFGLSVGDTSDAISGAGGQVILQVLDQRESSPRSFEEAREAAEADYRSEEAGAVALVEAEGLAARAGGEGLEAAAGERSLRTATGVRKRAAVPGLGLEPELNAAALETAVDEVGRVVAVRSGAVVFSVTERQDFDAEAFAQETETLRQELQQQRYQSLRRANLQELRARYGDAILMNDAILEPLRNRPSANPLG